MAMSTPAAERRNFVLVHGGNHGGWCWVRVADQLRARGHRVFTPTLTGLGERSHLAHAGVNCSTHIQDVVNVIRWEQLNDVVLCGHSYAGIVITGVADLMPQQIASLVYLDAAIIKSGESALDVIDPADRAGLANRVIDIQGQKMLPPAPAAHYNVNQADRAMVDALCTPQSLATVTECIALTGAHESVRKRVFIRATGWDGGRGKISYERVRHDPNWTLAEVSCGHDVMLDAPERLTELLLQAM